MHRHSTKHAVSVPEPARTLRTDADAYLLLEDLRWGGNPQSCPQCGERGRCYFLKPANGVSRPTRTGTTMSQRRVWKCGACRKQFSVLTGTIFHGTRVSVATWVVVIFDVAASENAVAAADVARRYEITHESAWHLLHRIRQAMKREPVAGFLGGGDRALVVAADGRDDQREVDPREFLRQLLRISPDRADEVRRDSPPTRRTGSTGQDGPTASYGDDW